MSPAPTLGGYGQLKAQAEDPMRRVEAARKAEIGAAIADIKDLPTLFREEPNKLALLG